MAEVRYKDFRREVARYRTGDLLPVVATLAARLAAVGPRGLPAALQVDNTVTPWALSAIARESIVSSSASSQPQVVTERNVRRLCRLYSELEDPLRESTDEGLTGFFVRTAFEQFPAQQSPFDEVARTTLLFITAASSVSEAPLFTEAAWLESLGVPLETFIAVGFLIYVWAVRNEGRVDLELLSRPHLAPIRKALDDEAIRTTIARYLRASIDEFRRMDSESFRAPGLLEHRFNPLEARPLVAVGGSLLAPAPALLIKRISPTGIYYDRCSEPGFTDQLGNVFERYIGMHLGLLPNATVIEEIEYAKSQWTVDWIVVFESIVLLVEVKSSRLTEQSRAGVQNALDNDIERTVVRAQRQIEVTAGLIRGHHPELRSVPTDRPLLGIVVTLEPYWLLGTPLTPLPKPEDASVPFILCSASDIEDLASLSLQQDAGKLLRAKLDSGDTGGRSLAGLPIDPDFPNPLLDAAWVEVHSWLEVAREFEKRGGF